MEEQNTTFSIKDLLSTKRETKALSERNELLEGFLAKINKERKGTKYKPMTPKVLGIKLAHIPTKDLYYLDSISKDHERRKGSYSKCFFGSLKVK